MLQRLYPAGYVFEDLLGTSPAAAGTLYVYLNTTTTLATIYSDLVGTTRSNPITLGSDGRLPTDVYVTDEVAVRLREYHATPASGTQVFLKDNMPNLVPTSADINYEGGTVDRSLEDKLHDFFHVADYGAGEAKTAAQNIAGFQAAVAAINTNGGGTLLFDPVQYDIYAVGSLSGSIILATFTGLNGVELAGRGATLNIVDTFSGSETLLLWNFVTCLNTTVHGFNFVQTVVAPSTSAGQCIFQLTHGCVNFKAYNIRQIGGQIGLVASRTAESQARATYNSSNITLYNWHTEDVGYPLSFQNSGDDVKIWNFRCVRPGRAYFPYGVRNHKVSLRINDPSTSPTCNLYTGITADSKFLEDITLHVEDTDSVSVTHGNLVTLNPAVDAGTPLAASMRNIHVSVNAAVVPGSAYRVLALGKSVNAVTDDDVTDRGHIIEGITFGGTITGAIGPVVDLMEGYGTWGQGEHVRNLCLRDLTVTGTTGYLLMGLTSPADHIVFDNVIFPVAPTFTGTAQLGIIHSNTTLGAVVRSHIITNSVQTITGSGAVDLTHRQTDLNTTGGGTYSLADGYESQRKTITMTVDSGTDGVVTPTNFVGNPSATITFNDVGDTAELLFTSGAWVFLGGTATVA